MALALAGCGDAGTVRRFCKLPKKCDCETPKSVDECESDVAENEANNRRDAEARGLAFDSDCFYDLFERFTDTVACRGVTAVQPEIDALLFCHGCDVVSGAQPEGAACQLVGLGSDCAPGLSCVYGLCLDVCTARPLGAPCTFTTTDNFTVSYKCADGWCDAGADACAPLRADGESCAGADECRSNWCDGTCKAPPTSGDPCTYDDACGVGRICKDGLCAGAPQAGQPCTGRCAPDLVCGDPETGEQICVRDQPWVCQ